jgi:hypothetical protein
MFVVADMSKLMLLLLLLLLGAGTWSSGLPANASIGGVQCQTCPTGQTSDTGATSPSQCCEYTARSHCHCL